MDRRCFLTAAGIVPVVTAFPDVAIAEDRGFGPSVGPWRTFEVVTKLEIIGSGADTRAWVPVPNVNSDWQQSLGSEWSGNAATFAVYTDPAHEARMVYAQWSQDEAAPSLEVVSRVKTRDRVADWKVQRNPRQPISRRVSNRPH